MTTLRRTLDRVFVRDRTPSAATHRLPAVLRAAGVDAGDVRVERSATTDPEVMTFAVRAGNGTAVMIRLASTDRATSRLRRAIESQRELRGTTTLDAIHPLIPEPLADGDVDGWGYTVETARPGRSLSDARLGPGEAQRGRTEALDAVGTLHRETARPIDPAEATEEWVERRVPAAERLIAAAAARRPTTGGDELPRLVEAARRSLAAGGALTAGWIHGDLWAANILVDDAGHVTGLVDWDSAAPHEADDLDPLHLVLFERRRRRHESLGETIVSVRGAGWDSADRALLETRGGEPGGEDEASGDGNRPPDLGRLVRYWLWFLEANVARHPGLAADGRWLERNVATVLGCR